ncbi:MAG TPA: ribosome maturation factor RimM [Geobacteraceae bacterium]|nr:ribosome maturation factor RimM [Geobacteraceae bacterium]
MPQESELVLLGKVVATHGVRGQLRVFLFSGDLSSIAGLDSVILKAPNGEMETFEVAATAHHGKKFLLTLKKYDNVNQVLHLVGRELYVEQEQLPDLPEGEYYWRDLVGLRVVTEQGEVLGTLTEIIATGSNDVYVVQGKEREYLIPALEEVVLEVNLDDGVMTVSPPEGLFDL